MPTDITNRYGSLSAWAYDLDKPIGIPSAKSSFCSADLKDCSRADPGALPSAPAGC